MCDLVSVVVPIYNVEPYLDRCLEAITNQSYKNLEIILVDDGSPDNCPALCDAWAEKDPRIQVIHKINAGLGEARNSGVRVATGKYIFFLDSDDYVALDTVQRCVCVARERNADTVAYGRNNVYPDGSIKPETNHIQKDVYEGIEITSDFLPGLFDYSIGFGVSAWSKMFNLEIIRAHGLSFASERAVISEDAMFCLEYFSKAKRVAVIADKLYFYVRNSNSLSRAFKADRQLKNNEFLQKSIERGQQLQLPVEVATHLKARYHGLTLGTMMQITRADLPKKEKKAMLRTIYQDDVLRQTLTGDVIRLDAFFPRVFWNCLRCRGYFLCDILLLCKK